MFSVEMGEPKPDRKWLYGFVGVVFLAYQRSSVDLGGNDGVVGTILTSAADIGYQEILIDCSRKDWCPTSYPELVCENSRFSRTETLNPGIRAVELESRTTAQSQTTAHAARMT